MKQRARQKQTPTKESTKSETWAVVLAVALRMGIGLWDLDQFTLDQLFDLSDAMFTRSDESEKDEGVRDATDADIDAFFA